MSANRPKRKARQKLESELPNKTESVPNLGQPQCSTTFQSVTALIRRALQKGWDSLLTGMKYGSHVVGIAAAIALYFDYSPKISVSADEPLNPSNAFTAPFIVGNDGYFAIRRVSSTCIVDITMTNRVTFRNVAVGGLNDIADKMSPGERLSVGCRFQEHVGTSAQLIRADIRIAIKYKSYIKGLLVGFDEEREFRFVSAPKPDGSWRWLPQPVSK